MAGAGAAGEGSTAGIADGDVTCESVLQWLLGVGLGLAEVSEGTGLALRLLLAGARAASEEARLELLAYEFFEQVGARPETARKRLGIYI